MSNAKIRTLPTTMVTGLWDPGSASEIPERIRIVLSNGMKATYQLSVEQPHPQCMKAIDLVRIMNGHTFGGTKNDR